ncbi:MAG: DUF4988 domain-containing protein, partial [Bacteroidales bacterium]|nr:DUF4988 domain-containing protein [Bacteroidales bacterium]
MKIQNIKTIVIAALMALLFTGCHKDIKSRINNLEQRVDTLEAWSETANNNIVALQNLLDAMETNNSITDIIPIMEGDVEIGYRISFSEGADI